MPTSFEIFVAAVTRAGEDCGALGEEDIVLPPEKDFGYESTPVNAITFGRMGVDGVHYAVLAINGRVTNRSPVIVVSPMDFDEPVTVIAESFVEYLALGCAAHSSEIERVMESDSGRPGALVEFLAPRFDQLRVMEGTHVLERTRRLMHLVKPKPGQG